MSKPHRIPAYMLNRLSGMTKPKRAVIRPIWPDEAELVIPACERDNKVAYSGRFVVEFEKVFGDWVDNQPEVGDKYIRSDTVDSEGNIRIRYTRKYGQTEVRDKRLSSLPDDVFEEMCSQSGTLVLTGTFEDYMRSLPDGEVVEVDRKDIDSKVMHTFGDRKHSIPEGTPVYMDKLGRYYMRLNGVKIIIRDGFGVDKGKAGKDNE